MARSAPRFRPRDLRRDLQAEVARYKRERSAEPYQRFCTRRCVHPHPMHLSILESQVDVFDPKRRALLRMSTDTTYVEVVGVHPDLCLQQVGVISLGVTLEHIATLTSDRFLAAVAEGVIPLRHLHAFRRFSEIHFVIKRVTDRALAHAACRFLNRVRLLPGWRKIYLGDQFSPSLAFVIGIEYLIAPPQLVRSVLRLLLVLRSRHPRDDSRQVRGLCWSVERRRRQADEYRIRDLPLHRHSGFSVLSTFNRLEVSYPLLGCRRFCLFDVYAP